MSAGLIYELTVQTGEPLVTAEPSRKRVTATAFSRLFLILIYQIYQPVKMD